MTSVSIEGVFFMLSVVVRTLIYAAKSALVIVGQ